MSVKCTKIFWPKLGSMSSMNKPLSFHSSLPRRWSVLFQTMVMITDGLLSAMAVETRRVRRFKDKALLHLLGIDDQAMRRSGHCIAGRQCAAQHQTIRSPGLFQTGIPISSREHHVGWRVWHISSYKCLCSTIYGHPPGRRFQNAGD